MREANWIPRRHAEDYVEGYEAGVNMAMTLEAPTVEQTLRRLEDCLDLTEKTRDHFKTEAQRARADGTISALHEAVQGVRARV